MISRQGFGPAFGQPARATKGYAMTKYHMGIEGTDNAEVVIVAANPTEAEEKALAWFKRTHGTYDVYNLYVNDTED